MKPGDELLLVLKISINWGCWSNAFSPRVIDCRRAAGWELRGESERVKAADLSLDAVWAEWVISVWPPVCSAEGRCSASWPTQPKVAEEVRVLSLLTLHRELGSKNIDILLQILKWQLLLLSKVKLIRSFRPTGRCLVHISTAWSPAQVPAAAAAASQSE